MSCLNGITKGITSNCSTAISGGLEVTAYMANRTELLTITKDVTNLSKITALAMNTGFQFFEVKGVKKLFNAGSEIVVADNRPNYYQHLFHLEAFELDAASQENLSAMDDVVVIVELKDKGTGGDGEFVILGLEKGLFRSADSWSANENQGARMLDLQSMGDSPEVEERWILDAGDRATTLALIQTLLIPAV